MASFFPSHRKEKPMVDFDVSCPQCEEKFKLNEVGMKVKLYALKGVASR
jgi:hypothetical protein